MLSDTNTKPMDSFKYRDNNNLWNRFSQFNPFLSQVSDQRSEVKYGEHKRSRLEHNSTSMMKCRVMT